MLTFDEQIQKKIDETREKDAIELKLIQDFEK